MKVVRPWATLRARTGHRDPRPKREENLISSSGSLLASRLVVAALGWAGTVLIVRTLTPSDWGRFAFIFSFLGLISVITDLGVGRVILAGLLDPATDREHLAGAYVTLRLTMGLIGYVIAVGFVSLAGYPTKVIFGTMVAGLVLVLATPSHGFTAVFQAGKRLRSVAVAETAGQFSQLGLTVAIVTAGGTLVWLTAPAVAFEVVALVYKLRHLPEGIRPRYRVDWPLWKRLLREAVPLAVGTILGSAFNRIDVVMLSRLDTFTATGIYSIAYKFADVVQFVAIALTTAALPALVSARPAQPVTFHRTFSKTFLLSFVAGALIIAEFVLFARPVITALYGHRYGVGANATKLVVVGEVAHFFSALAFVTLIAAGRNRLYPIVALGGLALNVGLNLWLIPAHSFGGAAIATLVTEAAVAGVLLTLTLRVEGTRPLPLAAAARGLIAMVVAVAVGAGVHRIAAWPLAAGATAAAFLAACHLVRVSGAGGLPALFRMEAVDEGVPGSTTS